MLTLLFGAALAAPPPAPRLVIPNPDYALQASQICYPSGLLVQIVTRPETDVAAITMVVGGGTSAETDATRGAAHLTEHLWFRSHPGGGPTPYELEAGLRLDGFTLPDATVYTTVGAPADLAGLLTLEGQRLVDPLQGITDADLTAERDIVVEELAWRGEHTERAALRYLDAWLWPEGHPYATLTTPVAQAQAVTLDAARAYAKASYRPETTAVRVESPLAPEAVLDALRTAWPAAMRTGPGTPCTRARDAAPPPAPRANKLTIVPAPTWKTQLYVAWSLPSAFGPDEAAMRFAVELLEDVVWTRVPWVRGVGGARDLTVGCSLIPGKLASEAVCSVELPDGVDPAPVHAAVLAALPMQWAAGTDAARRRSLGYAIAADFGARWVDLEAFDADAMVWRGLSSWFKQVDPMPPIVRATFATDTKGLAAFAERYLTPDRAVAVALVPGSAPKGASTPGPGRARLTGGAVPTWHPERPALDRISSQTLSNGATLWVAARPDAPYVAQSTGVLRGGWGDEPAAGATMVLDQLLAYLIPIDFDEMRLRLAMDFTAGHSARRARTYTRGAAGNLDLQLWVQRYLVSAGTVDLAQRQATLDPLVEDAFEAFRELPWDTSDHLRLQHLAPNDPGTAPWWERVRVARSTTAADVRGWQNTVYRPENTTIVVAGPVTKEGALAEAEKYLGGWRAVGKPLPAGALPTPPPPARKVMWFDAPTTQAQVALTCRLPGRADDAALDVLDAVIDRGLWQSLREDHHLYGFGADRWATTTRYALLQLDAAAPIDQGPAIATVLVDLVSKIRAGAPADVIARAKLDAAGRHARRYASASSSLTALEALAVDGRTLAELAAYPDRLAAVDAAAVGALLADCAGHEAISVIGPKGPEGAEGVDWRALGDSLARSLK